MSAHCTRLAEFSTQSATTVRALAVYHQKLALGAPSTLPPDGSRFQGGVGAAGPTDKEFDAAMAKASTSLEHHIFGGVLLHAGESLCGGGG